MSEARIAVLVARFDGAIKYAPMIKDHPDWTDQQCEDFARQQHTIAIGRLKTALKSPVPLLEQKPMWNDRIPYCRNIPTSAMLNEAK